MYQWYELPFQKGNFVQLNGLKNESMNHKRGTIIGFSQEKLRFAVKLVEKEEKIVLIKPDDLTDTFKISYFSNVQIDLDELFSLLDEERFHITTPKQFNKELKKFEKIFSKLVQENKDNALIKVIFYENIKFRIDAKIMQNLKKKFIQMDREIIQLVDEFNLNLKFKVRATCNLAIYCWDEFGDEKTLSMLKKFETHHYGQLKVLGIAISRVYTCVNKEKGVQFLQRVYEEAIKKEKERGFDVFGSNPCVLEFYTGFYLEYLEDAKNYDLSVENQIEEVRNFHDELISTSGEESNACAKISSLLSHATNLLENEPQKSLELLQQTQEMVSKNFGENGKFMSKIYLFKLQCFMSLKILDLKSARKCLKKLCKLVEQNFGMTREQKDEMIRNYTEMYEKLGNLMKRKFDPEITENLIPTKIKRKARKCCSNPGCEKMETKLGQFKICSRCEVASYCSKEHQIEHWKMT